MPKLPLSDVEELVWPEVLQEYFVDKKWEQGEQRDVRTRRVLFDRDELRRRFPDWPAPSAFARLTLTPASSSPWAHVPMPAPHSFFEPWHQGICASAVGALRFLPSEENETAGAASIGGSSAPLSRPWPECARKGHGPMTLLVSIGSDVLAMLQPAYSTGLVVHACAVCLKENRQAWLGNPDAIAVVEWNRPSGSKKTGTAPTAIPEVQLGMERIHSFPRSWVFEPRRDVEGHQPIDGPGATLFKVKLLRAKGASDPATAYDPASWVYDSHYTGESDGLFVGGFSPFRFAPCPRCEQPMRQVFHLNDYFTDGRFADVFEGSNELTLLACDRTAACGGPEHGLLLLDP